jgi:hypothetical protein
MEIFSQNEFRAFDSPDDFQQSSPTTQKSFASAISFFSFGFTSKDLKN